MKLDEATERLTKELVDRGKLIEAGWIGFEHYVMPKEAGPAQRQEMRNAFFAGAQHLMGSIMTFLEEGEEPTDADMRRMDFVHKELAAFGEELRLRIKTAGHA